MVTTLINNAKELSKFLFILMCALVVYSLYSATSKATASKPSYTVEHTPFTDVYIVDLMTEIAYNELEYLNLAKLIKSLSKENKVILKLHNQGGSINSMQILLNAIDTTKATVIAEVDGCAYSAAAVIACHAHELKMGPNSYLMFHNPRKINRGTGEVILAENPLRSRINQTLNVCVTKGIITQTQLHRLNTTKEDYEIYWSPNDTKPPKINKPMGL